MKQDKRKFEDPTRRDWVIGIGLLVVYLIVIGIGGVVLIPDYWLLWLLSVLAGALVLTYNQNRNYGCRCRICQGEFEIGFLTNLFAPHGIDKLGSWLRVKCPSCGSRGKVTVIRKC